MYINIFRKSEKKFLVSVKMYSSRVFMIAFIFENLIYYKKP